MSKIFFIFIGVSLAFPQSFHIKPYLQNASTSSMVIMWETTSGFESLVEWGPTQALGQTTYGTAETGYFTSYIHTVELTNLNSNTHYYYKVHTGNLESEIFDFKTPAEANLELSTRLVVVSDAQRDYSNVNKFQEVTQDGIINFVTEDLSGTIVEDINMLLVAGDLVDNGYSYFEWVDHFFAPAELLLNHVPLYPVYGNHENDTEYFTMYFNLPDNGSPGYAEHWWWKDNSNVRIIGLDSNPGYQIDTQLLWLESVLAQACTEEHIDFVFAELHHPHHSELWIAGNTDFTGDVIERLEQFSTSCGKPSIHFFGHTHGYSRGQSQDHQHVMVNVATAGGAIDNWGEYAQYDYPEYTVSQDEWGFVMVDIDAGDDPQFTIRRVSRGNENHFRDNEIRDQVTIRLWNTPPATPNIISPTGANQNPDNLILNGGPFSDSDGDEHGFSHWQVSESCDDFSTTVVDEFESHENWYFNENTEAGNSLTSATANYLLEHSDYCWRVRYRDKGLVWSNWSEPTPFSTGESAYSPNLLSNSDAENGVLSWTIETGIFESLASLECNGTEPYSGDYYFSVGGLCESADYAEVYQDAPLNEYFDCIENGGASVRFSGFLSNWGGDDQPEMHLLFLNQNGTTILESESMSTLNSSWTEFEQFTIIPEGTVSIRTVLTGTRNAGSDNDSYFDDLSLNIFTSPFCNTILGDLSNDGSVNILDVIQLVNIIMGSEPTEYQQSVADMNSDGNYNVLDVVLIVNLILGT
ncbi:MAG: fibronectin type III domain-containing protein [Candidatus Marinimicrobia bacterium]|nr:fibronectin type III domain-containing protein [Candidatus Neomarinimicrobiota bacterium]